MDAATIQSKIYAGYGAAALRVGYEYSLWRPTGAADPVSAGAPIAALAAAFTVRGRGFDFGRAGAHRDVLWNGLFDAALTRVGDYLVSQFDGETYYVAAQQPLLPVLCVKCDRVLTVSTPGPSKVFGADTNYGGTLPANETAVMTAWPGSVVFDARGRATEVGLPTDLPSPFFQILLPVYGGIDIRSSCFITDDLNRRYTVAAAEKTALGWSLLAQLAVT